MKSLVATLVLSLCLCLAGARPAGAVDNLLVNGDFSDSPDISKMQGVENHAGAWIAAFPVGTTQLPGWTVTRGTVYVALWKGNMTKSIEFRKSGGISQTIATVPGQLYRMSFFFGADTEGTPKKSIVVTVGDGQIHEYSLPAGHYVRVEETIFFTAKGARTPVEIYCSNGTDDQHLSNFEVVKWDAKVEALRPTIQQLYRSLSRSIDHKDVKGYVAAMAEDYTYKPKNGEVQSRDAFEASLGKLFAEDRLNVNLDLADLQVTDTQVTASIDNRTSFSETAAEGVVHRVVRQIRVVDTWVQAGSTWKLKSSEETYLKETVDGKPR